jgi:hypothetical protein
VDAWAVTFIQPVEVSAQILTNALDSQSFRMTVTDYHAVMAKRKKRRQRIDTMIDAHVWMRRTARTQGEWPRHKNPEAPVDMPPTVGDLPMNENTKTVGQ